MKKILTLLAAMFCLSVTQLKAQSVSYAKSLIEQERYMDAAKQLRPLADAGDAEAQYLAATLFFEGRGVAKNDEQGIKYAKLSADQGNTDAMLLLADHYKNNNQVQKYHQTLLYYIDRHPYLKNEFIGLRLAECYMRGWGVAQDEDKAWEMSKSNRFFKKLQSTYPYQWSSYKNRHPELYATRAYDDISVSRGPSECTIQKVVFEAERTVVYTSVTSIPFVCHKPFPLLHVLPTSKQAGSDLTAQEARCDKPLSLITRLIAMKCTLNPSDAMLIPSTSLRM